MSQVFCSHAGARVKTAKSLEHAVVCENIIAKMFAYFTVKFTYRENYPRIQYIVMFVHV